MRNPNRKRSLIDKLDKRIAVAASLAIGIPATALLYSELFKKSTDAFPKAKRGRMILGGRELRVVTPNEKTLEEIRSMMDILASEGKIPIRIDADGIVYTMLVVGKDTRLQQLMKLRKFKQPIGQLEADIMNEVVSALHGDIMNGDFLRALSVNGKVGSVEEYEHLQSMVKRFIVSHWKGKGFDVKHILNPANEDERQVIIEIKNSVLEELMDIQPFYSSQEKLMADVLRVLEYGDGPRGNPDTALGAFKVDSALQKLVVKRQYFAESPELNDESMKDIQAFVLENMNLFKSDLSAAERLTLSGSVIARDGSRFFKL